MWAVESSDENLDDGLGEAAPGNPALWHVDSESSAAESAPVPEPASPEIPAFGLFCQQLCLWYPFGSSQLDLTREADLMRIMHDAGAHAELGSVLRARQFIKHVLREEQDMQQLDDFGSKIQNFYASCNIARVGKEKLGKLQKVIELESLRLRLARVCAPNHRCMDPFKATIEGLQHWLRAFYSLDKTMRLDHFCRMYRESMLPYVDAIMEHGFRDGFPGHEYTLLGLPVCRRAFEILTCTASSVLSRCLGPTLVIEMHVNVEHQK